MRDAEAAVDARVTLDRTNFPGAVRLAASGVPEGVTLTMPTGPLRGGGATMSLRAARTAAAGEYPVTLTLTADGLSPVTTSFTLRVAEGGITLSVAMGRRPAGSPLVMVAGSELDASDRPTIGVARTCGDGDITVAATAPTGIAVMLAPSGAATAGTGSRGGIDPRGT